MRKSLIWTTTWWVVWKDFNFRLAYHYKSIQTWENSNRFLELRFAKNGQVLRWRLNSYYGRHLSRHWLQDTFNLHSFHRCWSYPVTSQIRIWNGIRVKTYDHFTWTGPGWKSECFDWECGENWRLGNALKLPFSEDLYGGSWKTHFRIIREIRHQRRLPFVPYFYANSSFPCLNTTKRSENDNRATKGS
jgi:hypothetical protein